MQFKSAMKEHVVILKINIYYSTHALKRVVSKSVWINFVGKCILPKEYVFRDTFIEMLAHYNAMFPLLDGQQSMIIVSSDRYYTSKICGVIKKPMRLKSYSF